ncbi:sulfatase [Algoriphagus machipongonensis]|uniref:Sulfatase family protein n=1 Tax=Algoriphagus machipongonensis TaxID=388413 RepID=A3I2G9_9BACT|nr:sulfatase [Algoriphagus machipongonensis]EAZ79273.1 sulfatase family protein [Algoriphagus machipongonensis]
MKIFTNKTVTLIWCLIAFASCKKETVQPPNVIVFLVDDLGWNDTSLPMDGQSTLYNQRYQTPNLEKLASQGKMFTHARSNAICVPSRVSLLTGQNFMRHQVKGDIIEQYNVRKTLWFPPGKVIEKPENMLPAMLKKQGYRTIISGKYHACDLCPEDKSPTPEAAGFDVNIAGTGFGAPKSYYGIDSFQRKNTETQPMPGLESYFGKEIHLTEALTIEALKASKVAVDKGQPFFLYLSHHAVHTPIQEQKPYRENYTLTEGEPEAEAAYATMIEGVDNSLGEVIKALDDWGIANNTLLIFYSDNGGRVLFRGKKSLYGDFEFNYPLRSGKASNYEGGIRVPCVVRWPGKVKKQTVSDAPLVIEDIYTTVLEATHTKIPDDYAIDGMSWLPVLEKEEPQKAFKDRSMFFFMPYRFDGVTYNGNDFSNGGVKPSASFIKGDWKLIYFFEEEIFELYNLKEDVGEQKNLFASQPEKAKEMINALNQNMAEKKITILPKHLPSQEPVLWPKAAYDKL